MEPYLKGNNVVVPEFLGRLGNGIFQVGACMNYSHHHGVPWAVIPHYKHRNIYRYFKSPIYKGNHKKLPVYDVATDEGFPYKELPNLGSVKLRGFFQSYRYLDPIRDQWLQWLNFKHYDDLRDFTSIHVRRGDYVTYSDSFPPVTMDYLHLAIEKVTALGFTKFLVFSDDIAWCKEHFNSRDFIFSEGKNEFEELSKMSSCKNNIIANSSFSWVGAYANQNPDKIVVSPSYDNWFGPRASALNTKDLIPPSWHQIKFR